MKENITFEVNYFFVQQYFGKSPRKTWNRGFESLESFDGQFRRIETVQENRNFREFRVSMRSLVEMWRNHREPVERTTEIVDGS